MIQQYKSAQINNTKKGQSIIADLMVSLAIFMILMVIIYFSWSTNVSKINDTYQVYRGENSAQRALDAITKSPGFPSNWAVNSLTPDQSELKGLGCAQGYNRLDSQKLSNLNTLLTSHYNDSRQKLGIGIYDADIKVSYLDSSTIYTMGTSPSSSTSTVLATKSEIATLDGQPVLVRVRVWKND
jgi:type II secretory pathway pseudopilin PulG